MLIEAGKAAIAARYRPYWHVVGAALRLRGGEIVTAITSLLPGKYRRGE